MTEQKGMDSIIGRVRSIGGFFTAAMITFMVLNLAMMFLYQRRYDNFVGRIDSVVQLKSIVYERVPDEMWEVIAGRKSIENCRANAMLDEVSEQLNSFRSPVQDTEILVVQRALDTMRGYVSRIEGNIIRQNSVDRSQMMLEDLRDVGSLTRDMLEDYIVNEIEEEVIVNERARTVFLASFIGEIVLWAVISVVSSLNNKRLAGYIESFTRQITEFASELAKGRMDARAPEMNTVEMVSLTGSLNTMAEKLTGLMQQNRIEQENLKKAELSMLQAQINPHFLYNTLDAIIWQAEAQNSSEVIHLTRALSNFFRISLSAGEEWITVAQERKHLEGYLSIQKVRYRDILEYEINIDPAMEEEVMLKLLLQPLVENALYHGIKLRRGGGKIVVNGHREGDELCFSVQDNGIGMSRERLEEICSSLQEDRNVKPDTERGSGFGLKNVNLRIRLYYDRSEGLQIESGEEGTTVSFRLPAGVKGNEHV